MERRTFLRTAALLAGGALGKTAWNAVAQASGDKTIWDYAAAQAFAKRLAAEHQFSVGVLQRFLSSLIVDERVIEIMDAPKIPGGKIYWREYRLRHLKPRKIARGRAFVKKHRTVLDKTAAQYGVPGHIAAAIIGVETNYGRVLGKFEVARTLATLAFAYPRRAAEFERQLAELLLYARAADINPMVLRGSFAGAFGMPQFLPGSARQYAVDFDNDGRIDLFSPADAIGSIGNFLQAHGWQKNGGLLYSANGVQNAAALINATKENLYRPFMSPADVAAAGINADALPDGKYLFVDLENRYDAEYYVGGVNFYALTRYNKSFKYAATVVALSREIA